MSSRMSSPCGTGATQTVPPRTSRLAWILVGLVLAARLVAVAVSGPPSLEKDAGHYHDLARNLARGHGFAFSAPMQYPWQVDEEGAPQPTARRPPLYPVLLSLLYRAGFGPQAMLWVQALVAAGTAWLLYRIAFRVGLDEAGAVLVLAAYLVYPPFTRYVTRLLTETWYLFLVLGGTLLLLRGLQGSRRRAFAAAGLIWGLATIMRPTSLLLPLAMFPFLVWPRRRAPAGFFLLVATFALGMSPWAIRNAITFGRLELTFTSSGYNLFMGTYPPTRGRSNLPPDRQPPELVAALRGKDEFEIDRIYSEAAWENVKRDPAGVLRLVAAKAVLCWFNTRPERNMFLPTPRSLAGNGPLVVAALVGFVLLCRRRAGEVWVPLLLIAYFMLVHMASVATVRYNLPGVPYAMLGAAGLGEAAWRRWRPASRDQT